MVRPASILSSSFAFLALALSLAGGCSRAPAPFDPASDCPKISVCGQCASRGGCGWCGDSASGQCVAVGHAECTAGWSKTAEVCPAPPAGAAPSATASASAGDSPQKKAVGAEKYAAIGQALRRAFPHGHVDDTVIDAAVELILRRRAGKREEAPIAKHVQEKDHRLYLGEADHHRTKSAPPEGKPMESEFVMALPMVRVALPEAIDPQHPVLATEIGDVDLLRDHLLGSVDLVAQKFADAKHLGYRPARIDLVTPARIAGGRFGAIAVYLGYKQKGDRAPSFYLLEAGTAGGDAKMIYFSPTMAAIPSVTSYYLPTAFVTMANTYSGGVSMKAAPEEDEIDRLVVHSRAPGDKDAYITVTVSYKRAHAFDLALPVELTADAGARVALIARTVGIKDAVELQELLANLGEDLYWKQHPHYTAPAASAPPPPR